MRPSTLEAPEAAKARGAVYTPTEITRFLARWAIRRETDLALEPSCGDGAFMVAINDRLRELGRDNENGQLFGVEVEPGEAAKARALAPNADIRIGSFFEVMSADIPMVDAVVGNPPYIRYHGFTGNDRLQALARAKEQGVVLSNLTSSWAPFLVHAAAFLKPEGRLALVLPAELLHTDYANVVRAWLLKRFTSVVIVTFDRLAFPDAQVDALLVLASNDDRAGLRVLRAADINSLATLDVQYDGVPAAQSVRTRWSGTIDSAAERVYEQLLALPGVRRLGDLASVDIGVVTGANKFFILDAAEARRRRLPASVLTPIVRTTSDTPGLRVRPDEAQRLLILPSAPAPKSKAVIKYLAAGKRSGVHRGYKTRTRTPWYRVPLPKTKPDAFLPYMNHQAPRLVVNTNRAWSTNLIHGVALKAGAPPVRALSAAMLSSATMLSAEIEGRAYGGGVLKLETKEAERLVIPPMSTGQQQALSKAFAALDALVRSGKLEEASERVDAILRIERAPYLRAYQVFRKRRLERKRTSR